MIYTIVFKPPFTFNAKKQLKYNDEEVTVTHEEQYLYIEADDKNLTIPWSNIDYVEAITERDEDEY